MRIVYKIVVVLMALLVASFALMYFIHVGYDQIGSEIAREWCNEKGLNVFNDALCIDELNSMHSIISQGLTLALFFFVIALTVISMEWRTGAAILAAMPLLILGIVPPQYLINAVSWDLILFLIGSMTLSGILRELGVFRYLALRIVEVSRDRPVVLLVLISLMAFILSAVLGEVTSIIYVTMLILEIGAIIHLDVTPLIVLSVLATNTGSVALPIGNPIGVYLLFKTGMSVTQFIRNAFPLAIIDLMVLLIAIMLIEKSIVSELKKRLGESKHRIEAYISHHRIELGDNNVVNHMPKRIILGLVILSLFILTVALNDFIVESLSNIFRTYIEPHAFLSFIPYIYIVVALLTAIPLVEVSKFVERSVEWPSLLFFIFLFMFGYMLTYTGVMAKLAYAFSRLSTVPITLLSIMLFSSSLLSSVLDNLSVIVAFTPIAMTFNNIGLIGNSIYFALLFGGVFGGNYTPVGSTANIIAVSLAEKRKIKISWGRWLRIALITTTLQILVALAWLYIISYVL
ncbi:MAG: SLC13 family permease [Ignisphaera sp.]